jgi:hypothetical protein
MAPCPHRRGQSVGVGEVRSSAPCRPLVPGDPLEPAKAGPQGPPTGRSGQPPLAGGDLACPQRGAQAEGRTALFSAAPGFSPLPSVVSPDAPAGQTSLRKEWRTRAPLGAQGHRPAGQALLPLPGPHLQRGRRGLLVGAPGGARCPAVCRSSGMGVRRTAVSSSQGSWAMEARTVSISTGSPPVPQCGIPAKGVGAT